jgi:hypothetical protein
MYLSKKKNRADYFGVSNQLFSCIVGCQSRALWQTPRFTIVETKREEEKNNLKKRPPIRLTGPAKPSSVGLNKLKIQWWILNLSGKPRRLSIGPSILSSISRTLAPPLIELSKSLYCTALYRSNLPVRTSFEIRSVHG